MLPGIRSELDFRMLLLRYGTESKVMVFAFHCTHQSVENWDLSPPSIAGCVASFYFLIIGVPCSIFHSLPFWQRFYIVAPLCDPFYVFPHIKQAF